MKIRSGRVMERMGSTRGMMEYLDRTDNKMSHGAIHCIVLELLLKVDVLTFIGYPNIKFVNPETDPLFGDANDGVA